MKINLIDNLGMEWDAATGVPKFDAGLSYEKFSTRSVGDLNEVWYDKNHGLDGGKPIYFMYRDITEKEGKGSLGFARDDKGKNGDDEGSIRFDLTIIPPLLVGQEFVKTLGHYHPAGFAEIYEVRSGEAWYLLQKGIEPVTEVYLIKIKKGEKILIPSGYGHVTINAQNEPLIMTNYVSDLFVSDYKPYLQKHGAAYFVLKDAIIKNEQYQNLPALKNEAARFIYAKEVEWPELQKLLVGR